ncbi:hypothetical protein [Nocardia grenadensis]|uniref:hypothetical protein n=1 Tax=Nocardia grenadensis TaxID=931537 RepID=UPI003D75A880
MIALNKGIAAGEWQVFEPTKPADSIEDFFAQMDQEADESWIESAKAADAVRAAELEAIRKPWIEAAEKRRSCTRCDGSGYINAYRHWESGRCFKCN